MAGRKSTPVKYFLMYKKYSDVFYLVSSFFAFFFVFLGVYSCLYFNLWEGVGKGHFLTSGDFRFWLAWRSFGEMI